MKTSESITKIAPALVAASAAMTDVKRNAENPFHKSEYADLKAVVDVIRPILAENKMALTQWPSFKDGFVTVVSRLVHESGEWMEDESSVGVLSSGPQPAGAAITYLRRYSAMAICGIAPEDDDANPGPFTRGKKGKASKAVEAKVEPKSEKSMYSIVSAFPADVKELFVLAGINPMLDRYTAYKNAGGDLVALKKALNVKIQARDK